MKTIFHRAACLAFAALLFLALSSTPLLAQDAGSFLVTFDEVSQTLTQVRESGRVEFVLSAPDSNQARVQVSNWPLSGGSLPPDLKKFELDFQATADPAQADRALTACTQAALITEAKPNLFDLLVWLRVPDVSLVTEPSAGRLESIMGPGYIVSCSLKRQGT